MQFTNTFPYHIVTLFMMLSLKFIPCSSVAVTSRYSLSNTMKNQNGLQPWLDVSITHKLYPTHTHMVILMLIISVLEIAVSHWLFSDQLQNLAEQNQFWLAKFPVLYLSVGQQSKIYKISYLKKWPTNYWCSFIPLLYYQKPLSLSFWVWRCNCRAWNTPISPCMGM